MTAETLFDYAESRARRDAGMKLASEHSPDFSKEAYAALVRVAKRQLVLFADDLIAELKGRKPGHPNAWGPVWQRAVHEGVIQRTNQVKASHDPVKRARVCPIYFSLVHRSI